MIRYVRTQIFRNWLYDKMNKFESKLTLHLTVALFLSASLLFSPFIVASHWAVIDGNDFDNSLYGTMADVQLEVKVEVTISLGLQAMMT